jgi:type I restriction enzyme, S subunit
MPDPPGWQVARLEDIAATFSGGTPSRENPAFFGGGIPWVKSGEVNLRRVRRTEETISKSGLDESSARVAPRGSVLVAMYGATAGKVALLDIEAAINQAILAVVARSDRADGRFLFHALEAETPALLRKVQGSGQPNLSGSILRQHDFAIPPLGEQRKIAAILSSVDDAIEATQAVIDQLQVVKKAMMAELLTRGLPGRHTRFKQTDIGEMADEWQVRPLREVATIFNGKATGTGGTWLRVFKTKHVYDGNVRLLKPEYARDDVATRVPVSTFLRPDDVLTPNMAHGTIGRVAFVPSVEDKWTVDGQVMVIRTNSIALIGRFVFEWLSLPQGRQRLLDLEKGGAFDTLRGQTHIYPKDVREIAVPVPSLQEQRAIGGCAASFDGPLTENADALRALSEIKQGLMSVLLTGEVRVTPDEAAA